MFAMVLEHLYAILMFVLLVLVTLCVCGDMYMNVAHFLFFLSRGVACFMFYLMSEFMYYCGWETVLLGDVKVC